MNKIIILLITILLTNCTSDKVLFTLSVRNQIIKDGIPLEKLQFYTEKQFELHRELSNSDITYKLGKIKQLNGKKINILNFPTQTPCMVKKDSTSTMYFDFEEGEKRYLKFFLFNRNGEYRLAYNSLNQELEYAGEIFKLKTPYEIRLLISKSSLNSVKLDKKTVKGIRVK